MMLSEVSFISLPLRYCLLAPIVEQPSSDGKTSPAEWSELQSLIDCMVHYVLLYLQQICSRISLSGCEVEPTKRWANGAPFIHRGPLFLLFLQEIISDRPL